MSRQEKEWTRAEFRRRVEGRDNIVTAPGAYDALTAKLVQRSGFEAVYLSGAGVSYSTLGQPDLGLISFHEMLQALQRVRQGVAIPIIADADNGYGNALNVRRTVQMYEAAGAFAIQLEDQAYPKKCGHLAKKVLIPAKEGAMKIKAAVDARQDPNTLIIARTDALAVNGFADALERAKRYEDAGADVIFVEAPTGPEQMAELNRVIAAPCLANMVEGGKTPLLPNEELQKIGYRIVIYPNMVTRIVARHVERALASLRDHGSSQPLLQEMMLFPELNRLLGIEELNQLEQMYAVD
ncbi:isocitrate lyase/PEP mutase family protein [Alicyclobacillus cycloheptanicus]|uniref:2-methylisocitrate lyase-like PEP mutase family enzyme n=1 Tax=Alicyclobacillus cycloheptanicus TaxID=1457 RepID=A0ABT9XHW2_9BACL|nr:isocitrate lyase/PEP mutase family protein [Alicyclobacillus cycloheptanicus]MDQ0189910.1 2-methylisocitrate lyase-like PEP mutase family enzyme [Alicyclobacillus cycloheptanicus]WDM02187.1 isocitrate lyase/PEP mutase family protein [Alicyclobacillus cycloheptanicus]